jgi:cysteine-rich repeat protein
MRSILSKSVAVLAAAVVLSFSSVGESRAGDVSCGDLNCDIGESCESCPGDCGLCCGNDQVDPGEGCDDNNNSDSDGCSADCLIEIGFACSPTEFPLDGDQACASGICDETEVTPVCEASNTCDNSVCEVGNLEDCSTCPQDCGACPPTTSTTSTTVTTTTSSTSTSTTSTLPDATTTSTLPDATTTSTLPDATTTSTLPEVTTTSTLPDSTTTSTLPDSTTTSTLPDTTTTTSLPETTTTSTTTTSTTSTTTTSTTTLPADEGACCFNGGCQIEEQSYCIGELLGTYAGDETSCSDPGVCSTCGNGCIEFSEQCDDADTETGDGCDDDCQEEQCWSCSSGQLTGGSGPVACLGGGPSFCSEDEFCAICGDGEVELGEQCDDGVTPNDCCTPGCQFVAAQVSCSDGLFCTGAETCDGSGNCLDAQNPSCTQLDGDCVVGFCDGKLDACVPVPVQDGAPCEGSGPCTTGEGSCSNGVCVGTGSTLSPTCRWIIVGGSPMGDVRVRTGPGSTVDADICTDTGRIGGTTTDDIVAILPTGEAVRFYGPPEVAGDIVTGGGTIRSNLYLTIPGTNLKFVDTGVSMDKLPPPSKIDTTGNHVLVDVCSDDQTIIQNARTTLNGMGNPDIEEQGLKVGVGSSKTIDVTGLGVSVVDMPALKVSHGASLTLKGNPTDVVVLRVGAGRLKFGYGANLVLDGLVPENVLIYAASPRCRLSPGVAGSGTVYCPDAGRFIIGAGVDWSGTFLGSTREVRVRKNAALTHIPFTGF